MKNYAPWWASHTLDWLKYGKKVQVVHFEDLKRDLFSWLKGMVIFLGLEVSEDRLLCVEGQKDGNFKRSGLRKLEYDPYTPEMRATIDRLIKTVDTALRKRNLSGVPEEYRPRWYSSLHLCFFSQHTFFPAIPIFPLEYKIVYHHSSWLLSVLRMVQYVLHKWTAEELFALSLKVYD